MVYAALQRLVEGCDGTLLGVVIGADGAPQEICTARGVSGAEGLAAEVAALIAEVGNAAQILALGRLDEVLIRSAERALLVRVMADQRCLALALRADGNLGKARYLARSLSRRVCS